MLVTEALRHEFLLGSDGLAQGNGVIDYANNVLNWFGKDFVLHSYPDISPAVMNVGLQVSETSGYACIDDILEQYYDVFCSKDAPFGFCDLVPLTINTGDAAPIYQRPYHTPLAKRLIVEQQVKDMLKAGVIEPSASPWSSPITLVPKPGGETRFCVDYRKLNAHTQRDSYPLPLIQDIFDQLGGASIFSTLDLESGYWQIPVAEEDRPKTAFICHKGLYQFRRVPFGLCNAPGFSKEQWIAFYTD